MQVSVSLGLLPNFLASKLPTARYAALFLTMHVSAGFCGCMHRQTRMTRAKAGVDA